MRGLSPDEAWYLTRSTRPLSARWADPIMPGDPRFGMAERAWAPLVARGLITAEGMLDQDGDFIAVPVITPLGRIALACHAAIKTLEAA